MGEDSNLVIDDSTNDEMEILSPKGPIKQRRTKPIWIRRKALMHNGLEFEKADPEGRERSQFAAAGGVVQGGGNESNCHAFASRRRAAERLGAAEDFSILVHVASGDRLLVKVDADEVHRKVSGLGKRGSANRRVVLHLALIASIPGTESGRISCRDQGVNAECRPDRPI